MTYKSSGQSDIIDVCLELHHQTEKAILVSDDGIQKNAKWLPLSQIEVEKNKDGTITVTAPQWLLKDKGFI